MTYADPLRRAARHWPLALALAIFLAFALPDLGLPGLHYDEALEAATPALLLLRGQPLTIINNGAIEIGGQRLPLMVQNHIGAIQIYAAMPFVALLGPTAEALRLMTVLVGAITLAAVYAFAAQVWGRWAAGTAALALAVFPSFIFWSRQGVFITNISPCMAALAFALGARWWRTRGAGPLFLAGLAAGLAIYAKVSALWLLNGAALWAALCWLAVRGRGFAISPRRVALACAGLGLGVLPVVAYNLITGFATFAVVEKSASTTYLGTSNQNLLTNLQTRLAQAADVIGSGQHLWYLGGQFPNPYALPALAVALGLVAARLWRERGLGWQRELLVPLLGLGCVAQSCFTISALWYTHFAIAVWLPALVLGAGAEALARVGAGRWRWAGPTAALLAVLAAAPQAASSWAYLGAVRSTGGLSFHSSAIADVSRFLAARPEPVVALDWGFSAPIEYLTGGQKRVEELYGFSPELPPDFTQQLASKLDTDTLYLTHSPGEEAFTRRQAFLDAVAAAGLRAEQVNRSVRKDGLALIEVWKLSR
ncbi:hypothetical protein F8S13_05205 [Chloroflexia bacterium SDU3-3]|nr:hypothetical protein F8S13_05205 [Chloroflexia bacterium SDU3-3]